METKQTKHDVQPNIMLSAPLLANVIRHMNPRDLDPRAQGHHHPTSPGLGRVCGRVAAHRRNVDIFALRSQNLL